MNIHAAKLHGAHFAPVEYKPSQAPYWFWGAVAAFVVGTAAAVSVNIAADKEPTPTEYRVNDADAYGVERSVDSAALGIYFAVNSLKQQVAEAQKNDDVAGCEQAKASLLQLDHAPASQIICEPPGVSRKR